MTASEVIERLGLEPLPHEGGFFRRVFESDERIVFGGVERPAATMIYFLVTPEDFSALHLLRLPELYTHIAGDCLKMGLLDPRDGSETTVKIGPLTVPGAVPFFEVAEGVWQGSRLDSGGTHGWALVTCTLGPGFDWSDCTIGAEADLLRAFPRSKVLVQSLTRG